MLFEHQADWSTNINAQDIFVKYAKNLGLDTDKFTADVNAGSTMKFINDEENAGTEAGVQGTPTFFLNAKQIENPRGYEPFKQLLQQALKR